MSAITTRMTFEVDVSNFDVEGMTENELATAIHKQIDDFLFDYINKNSLDEKWQYEIEARILNELIDSVAWKAGKNWSS